MKLLTILTKPCSEVTAFDPELKALVADLTYTMLLNRGVGLAANQVGVSLRVIVWAVDGKRDYLINPAVQSKSGVSSVKEGCLSLPGVFVEVPRSRSVVVCGVDLGGNPKTVRADGLLSIVLQHETDHLNGLTLLNHTY
jgi:peptide deformylase